MNGGSSVAQPRAHRPFGLSGRGGRVGYSAGGPADLDQAVLHREQGVARPRAPAGLVVHVGQVVLHGPRRDHELVGDLLFDRPRAASRSTSTSRSVRSAGHAGRPRGAPAASITAPPARVEPAGPGFIIAVGPRPQGRERLPMGTRSRSACITSAAASSRASREMLRRSRHGDSRSRPSARGGRPASGPKADSAPAHARAPARTSTDASRTWSVSPALRRPGRSQIDVDTLVRPTSCKWAVRRSARPRPRPGSRRPVRRRPPRRASGRREPALEVRESPNASPSRPARRGRSSP